ncbi:ParB/RepB/Spo0J family partition protein [Streptomyces sp. NPDC018019]|uniref:ParB/RepB/Spo0J family partition protein n=1 Tax=Streptomyces sp. NPDC018019 TaxID=3365030 RepID=UPI0037B07848
MTTTTAPTSPDSTEPPPAQPAFEGRFAWVDPYELVIDPYNHRQHRTEGEPDGTEPDPDLIASVEEVGVQSLVLLRPQTGDNEGKLGIIFGQRRCKAAIIAADKANDEGRSYMLVPALIRDDLRGVDDEALTLSVIENKHRRDANARDYVEAARQLSLMPLPQAAKERHARALGLSAAELSAAGKASKLDDKNLSAAAHDFDLVELADYQEVAHISNARSRLEAAKARDRNDGAGTRGHWAHALQCLKDEAAEKAKRAQLKQDLAAAGVTLVDWHWQWRETPTRPLTDLATALGTPITADQHAKCPGHAATLNPFKPKVVWLCTRWQANQHKLSPEASGSAAPNAAEMAAKRRRTIRYNAAWRQARPVRQEFIANLCARPGDAPDEIWKLILTTITGTSDTYSRYISRQRTDLISTFLKIKDPNHDSEPWRRVQDPFGPLIARTGPTARWRLLFAQVAAMYEHQAMSDQAWRDPISKDTTDWLAFLQRQKYALSDVEAEVLDTVPERSSGTAA